MYLLQKKINVRLRILFKLMGNMSNPNVNRWGLNLFWYRYWCGDYRYASLLQHDDILNLLVYSYLNFGVLYPKNIFVNKYWNLKIFPNYQNMHNSKYYRIMSFKNFLNDEISYYNERLRIENVYQSRIWILKFQHWVLINFYCFNPLKKRQVSLTNKFRRRDSDVLTKIPPKDEFLIRRLRFFFLFFKKITVNDYYFF